MKHNTCKRIIAAIMAAILLGGCGTAAGDAAPGNAATEECESCEAVNGALPESFRNLASDAVLTQSADEETHVQTNVLDLGEVRSVGYFRILWPDLEIQNYQIEGSLDGETYETLYTADSAPYFMEDQIALEETVSARYIRLSAVAASALPVPEVYAEDPWESVEDALVVSLSQDVHDHTLLVLTGVPEGIAAAYGGCNYEEIIAAIGDDTTHTLARESGTPITGAMAIAMDTIEDRTVSVGFTLTAQTPSGAWTHDTGDYEVSVPAQDTNQIAGGNARPDVIPAIQEWDGGDGTVTLPREDIAWVQSSAISDSADGRIRYEMVDDPGLGTEGYRIDIGCGSAASDGIRVYANQETGLYWGNVTLRQMISLAAEENGSAGVRATTGETAAERASEVEEETGETTAAGESIAGDESLAAVDIAAIEEIALPRGRIRDYPIGAVRGIMLDVGRNTMSLAQIGQIAMNLSWFKMNELTLHLQDNALLTYSDRTDSVEHARTAYSAYRMESDITGDDGTSITAEDLSYTAEEFADLVETCAGFGVAIIPEIDTPAHSLALTSVFTDLGLSGRPDAVDMLDCSNPDALTLVQEVWDEQLSGAFADAGTIQIGGDEYYGRGSDFVNYETGLIEHLATSGRTIRMWGSLTALMGDTRISPVLPESGERIQMQLWSTYWADPLTMYRAGFALINSSSNRLYINCGEATDYLDKESVYETYQRTVYAMEDGTTQTLPSWSPRVMGSSAALWNDLVDNLEIGISEYDMTDRVLDALPVLADVFWQERDARTYEAFTEAAAAVGLAPESDPLHQRDDLLLGPDYEISFEVYLPSGVGIPGESDTIFCVEIDGNTYAFKARQYDGGGTGQVGFSREFCDYRFDYTLPLDTWVRLTVVSRKDVTSLYVDGELADTIGSSEAYAQHATFLFPTQVNPEFVGEVRNVQ